MTDAPSVFTPSITEVGEAYGAAREARFVSVMRDLEMAYPLNGERFVIVCDGRPYEAPRYATETDANALAAELANLHKTAAYILKPIRSITPTVLPVVKEL